MIPTQSAPTAQPQVHSDALSLQDLTKHRGHWMAYSRDGSRLIASCPTLAALDAQVRAAGEDPEEVLLERVPDGDFIASSAELS